MTDQKNSFLSPDLKGRVAIITGGSRGIGRECALALARRGCNIVVAAKSIKPKPGLPGSIFTVAKEVSELGVQSLPVQVDIRDEAGIANCVKQTIDRFGRIDILINNASALWWHTIKDTPAKKYDLITQVNVRGTFLMTKYCLPHMSRGGFGRVITMSPPIRVRGYRGFTAYNISKMGMTMVALGVAEEYDGKGITAHSLWPATIIESQASKNFKLGTDRSLWRKASILADCVVGLVGEPDTFTGQMLIDDEYLQSRGFGPEDLVQYRYDPKVEPPRLLAMEGESDFTLRRGDVAKVEEDERIMAQSKL